MMMTWDTFWQIDRVVLQAVVLIVLVLMVRMQMRTSRHTGLLLQQAQTDREAREQALLDLKRTADALAEETRRALIASDLATKTESGVRRELKSAIEQNTVIIETAAKDAHKALEQKGTEISEALALNSKLIQDNTRKTEQAAEAAHDAYKEANSVNTKISDLNKRLLTVAEKEAQTRSVLMKPATNP